MRIGIKLTLLAGLLLAACRPGITVVGGGDCDLVRGLREEGFPLTMRGEVGRALEEAEENSALLILSGDYPGRGTRLSREDTALIGRKNLRVLIEFPEVLAGQAPAGRTVLRLERMVVCDSLSEDLPGMGLLTFNQCVLHTFDTPLADTLLVAARVAGFDRAAYGLKDTPVLPALYRLNENIWVCGTRLSDFASCIYRPEHRVKALWEYLLARLTGRRSVRLRHWPAYIGPAYGEKEKLPGNAGRECVRKGVEWYDRAHLLVDSSWKHGWVDRYIGDGSSPTGPALPDSLKTGDGSLGVLEGHTSGIDCLGRQQYRYWLRYDVQGESAYAFASAGTLLDRPEYLQVAARLLDYAFREFRDGERDDPASPSYGLLGWATTHKHVYYGDDNARGLLAALGASALLGEDRWDRKIAEGIAANFRTTGRSGFRGDRIEAAALREQGWEAFHDRDEVNPHPHFEAWPWACYLWLYDQTGYRPLLDRVRKAVDVLMETYPDGWLWTNGIQQEKARMLLPLAWLYRVEPTERRLRQLRFMTDEVLKNQADCGAIREELGAAGKGAFGRTPSNAAYGLTEAPLIFENGNPVADLLYTTNFAFAGLCEAAAATGDPEYRKALLKMEDFLIRAQVRSGRFKSVDGAWFRAFNFGDWNYWASNADAGWGAWSTLTGWIQSWITGTVSLIERGTSLWDLAARKEMKDIGNEVLREMRAAPEGNPAEPLVL